MCSLIDVSQYNRESIEFPGVDKSITMQMTVFSKENWFKGADKRLERILPPPIKIDGYIIEMRRMKYGKNQSVTNLIHRY